MTEAIDPQMESFMSVIRQAGFTGCPVCKSENGFTWAHSAELPGAGIAHMTAYLPGSTTVPGDRSGRMESFPTPLFVLICDRCTHVMMFAKIQMMLKMAQQQNGK